MPRVQEWFWDNLLDYVEAGTVVPVIGPELVTVRDGDRDVPLYRFLAQRLATARGLPTVQLPEDFDLNDVVSLHVRGRGDREEIYAQVHRMLRSAALTPPEALRTLAGIPGFDLFVSLTFDSLLADAVSMARSTGPRAEQIAYSPSTVRDLACPKAELRQPVVFHLLGRASASPDYAICDEDLLEFLHAMQDKQRQPKTLFDELRGNHLLILGCSFGDWLARFFLRTARNLELSQKRKRWDVLVGDQIGHDARLALFLETFSPDTRVLPLTAAQFVTELARRWHAAHPAGVPSEKRPNVGGGAGAVGIPTGAVFVSYTSEDLDAAETLSERLKTAGLEVWFDKDNLHLGDDWERSIRRGIEECSLFLPVLSRQALSEQNRRKFFWTEWRYADKRAEGMALDEKFIIPVAVDDTRIDGASLPDSFKKAQGKTLLRGEVTPDVAEWLKNLVRDFHRRQRAT